VVDGAPLQSVAVALALENKLLTFDVNLEQCERASLKPKKMLLELSRNARKASERDVKAFSPVR
jgi:hypothetical protein